MDGDPFSVLEPDRNVGYGPQRLPSPRDGEIRDLLLHAADRNSFEHLVKLMPGGAEQVLTAFAERAASIAVRHQDARELRAGLLASMIAQAVTGDPEATLGVVTLLHRAAYMIGNDPDSEFRNADELSGGNAPGLVGFLSRAPQDRSVQAMGYVEGNDEDGFRFNRTSGGG